MIQFLSPPLPHFICCGEDTYPIGGRHPDRSSIGVFDLLVVTRGCLHLSEDPLSLTVPAGSFALLRPDRFHRTALPCEEETHFYWLHFHTLGQWKEVDERPDAINEGSKDAFQTQTVHQFAHYLPQTGKMTFPEAAYGWLRELLDLEDETTVASQWRQQILFQELLLCLQQAAKLPASSSYISVADEASAYLRRNYKTAVSYKAMAEELHFHANYISLCMKRAYGCTPLEYLATYRIEQAKRLLIDTNETIGRIAEETGFGTFSYFIRSFNRLAGCTPKEFRTRYR
ncbi:AraC-like DNA-binding protein [Paenibacillus phyllosphaerae]|uniref:AraC-like DNA-binding protein n=1 Tax=Paenibacillus phyllosphaerae TaxID=274593 RepID=A0A7W5FNS3_9BACL|nr:AraC family transcriptional regulator [Paenibacillus phyllosphaerae]MBB3111641.1 AraC-like DNA-binding protein [Paenibacillus phyllosphaerae]